jgi:hypothetical protein
MRVYVWAGQTAEKHSKFSWGNKPINSYLLYGQIHYWTLHKLQSEYIKTCLQTHRKYKIVNESGDEIASFVYNTKDKECALVTKSAWRKQYRQEETNRVNKVKDSHKESEDESVHQSDNS